MDFKIIIKSKAKLDLKVALDWYRLQNDHLPEKLFIKINEKLESIKENPFHFQERYKNLRLAFTKQFPFGIYFSIEEEIIYVHAILHTKRNPEIAVNRAN